MGIDPEEAIADFRPSAHVERLELMDLLAVKECTDTRFRPSYARRHYSTVPSRTPGDGHLKGRSP